MRTLKYELANEGSSYHLQCSGHKGQRDAGIMTLQQLRGESLWPRSEEVRLADVLVSLSRHGKAGPENGGKLHWYSCSFRTALLVPGRTIKVRVTLREAPAGKQAASKGCVCSFSCSFPGSFKCLLALETNKDGVGKANVWFAANANFQKDKDELDSG